MNDTPTQLGNTQELPEGFPKTKTWSFMSFRHRVVWKVWKMFGQWYYKPVSALNFRVYKDDICLRIHFEFAFAGRVRRLHIQVEKKSHIFHKFVFRAGFMWLWPEVCSQNLPNMMNWSISYWLSLQISPYSKYPSRYPSIPKPKLHKLHKSRWSQHIPATHEEKSWINQWWMSSPPYVPTVVPRPVRELWKR